MVPTSSVHYIRWKSRNRPLRHLKHLKRFFPSKSSPGLGKSVFLLFNPISFSFIISLVLSSPFPPSHPKYTIEETGPVCENDQSCL